MRIVQLIEFRLMIDIYAFLVTQGLALLSLLLLTHVLELPKEKE
jgi:hypothetical protein